MASRKRKPTFVLVVPRFENILHSYYAGEIIHGVSLSASRLNFDFIVRITDREDHRGWLDSTLMDPTYIDGIIFADIDNDLSVVKKAIKHSVPCMVLNNILKEPINYVAVDNYAAAFDAVERLIKKGHRKIATIAGDLTTQAGTMRLEGYKAALEKHKLPFLKSYVKHGDFLRSPARRAAEQLLNLSSRPTAIFAASDVMAMEVLDVARKKKISVPQKLSIVGFDNNSLGAQASVPLTTVAQPIVEMGRLGAENLFKISRGQLQLPVKVVLPTNFVERAS